jgi:hypothetical protein
MPYKDKNKAREANRKSYRKYRESRLKKYNKYIRENSERYKEWNKKWHEEHAEQHSIWQKKWNDKHRFRLALQSAQKSAIKYNHKPCNATESEIRESFTGSCFVCGKKEGKRKLHMDHSHTTGEFRGWLCSNCNVVIGMLKENTTILKRAITYLEKNDSTV